MPFLDDFLTALADELNGLGQRGLLPASKVRDGDWIRYSWLHARIHAAAIRAVPAPWYPASEVKWSGWFKPDICVVDDQDHTVAVVEYESVNSSDERLMGKDMRHFQRAIQEYQGTTANLPPFWIIISTLPDEPVAGWRWYGWNRDLDYPPPVKDRAARDANPLAYYSQHLHAELGAMWTRIRQGFGNDPDIKLVWVNLMPDAIRVMNINGVQQPVPQEYRLHLP